MIDPRHRRVAVALTLLASLALPRGLQAQATASKGVASKVYGELLKRTPESANLLMFVDVNALLDSPMGQREGWRKMAEGGSGGGLGLGPETGKSVVASSIDLDELHENWILGLGEMQADLPDLGKIARREGGYVEAIGNTKVVWSPRNFYLFAFPPRTLGYASRSDRQALTKWLSASVFNPRTFPPGFADRAIIRADEGSQLVLALNLKDAISPRRAQPWLATIEAVRKANLDPKLLADRMATAKSAYLKIDVAQEISGTIQIEFESPMKYASGAAKEIVLTLLDSYGVGMPDLETWQAVVDNNTITLTGRMSTESIRRILSFARPPRLAPEQASYAGPSSTAPGSESGSEADAPAAANAPEPAAADALKASQAYFRSVVDLLDGLKSQPKGSTYSSTKVWYEKYARRIEELPILNVDTALLDWGTTISRTLREMASGVNYSAQSQSYNLAASPNGSYGGYGYYYANSKGYDQAVLKRQSNAQLSVGLDQRWQAMQASIPDMRRQMVEKYKVDF